VPKIYCYVGNRLTQYVGSANAFRTVVNSIGEEILSVWRKSPGSFHIHPEGSASPKNPKEFRKMFQFEVVDANTASVVSSALGIPLVNLFDGKYEFAGKRHKVNQSQLDRQKPNIKQLVEKIE
jgi:hypothetical protein